MKKKILLLPLFTALALFIAACGDKAAPEAGNVGEVKDLPGIKTLGQYTGLTVQASKSEVGDEEFSMIVNQFFAEEASSLTWNKEAENGDTCIIDFVGKVDGIAFDGGTAEDYSLVLGSHSFIDGFEEKLIGMTVGETIVLDLAFPESYHNADLAGKPCEFTVTVKKIIPTINDANVAALQSPKYSTQAEYETFVHKVVDEYYENDYRTSVVAALLQQIIALTEWDEMPAELLEIKKAEVSEAYSEQATAMGVDVATYLTYYGTTYDAMAESLLKNDLIFDAIATSEGFTTTDEELDAYVNDVLKEAVDTTLTPEDIYGEEGREEYKTMLIKQKVFDFLIANNTVTDSE